MGHSILRLAQPCMLDSRHANRHSICVSSRPVCAHTWVYQVQVATGALAKEHWQVLVGSCDVVAARLLRPKSAVVGVEVAIGRAEGVAVDGVGSCIAHRAH